MIEKLIKQNRSYRRFYQDYKIGDDLLLKLINYARQCGSAANLQPLKYFISNDAETNAIIFDHIAWAGYLPDWPGPNEGERPSSYIVILGDKNISKNPAIDVGISAQTILLGATENDLGGCMFGAIKRKPLKHILDFAENLEIYLIIAIGKPKEIVVLEEVKDNNIKYWRDGENVHHVPKRKLRDIIINLDI